jgi:Na+/H+ antiporter NhaC
MKQKISTTLFAAHKKRVEKVKAFTGKNKIFVAMMIFAAVFLFINFVIQPNNQQSENQQCESEVIVCENAVSATEPETWRFYFIDVIVLVVGGGFCTVMILRERRRTREELK